MGLDELIVGVDGGGTKTDVLVATRDGELVARARGAGCSPHFVGLTQSVATVDALVEDAVGASSVAHIGAYISGLDLASEIADYRDALAHKPWAQGGLLVDNDMFALLASGSSSSDAVAVVCGTGVNAVGVNRDGQVARFLSLGELSGDWGGGLGLGQSALWHAARDVDGRGRKTLLTTAIESHFAMPIPKLIESIHLGSVRESELASLAPAVFAASDEGDEVAGALVDRQAEEVGAYVRACARRLRLSGPVDVVLGGSILQAGNRRLMEVVEQQIRTVLPDAMLKAPAASPVVGALLLAMRGAGVEVAAQRRVLAAAAGSS